MTPAFTHARWNTCETTLVCHPDRHTDVSTEDQLKELRSPLERSGEGLAPSVEDGVNLLVVINHRLARVYRTRLRGSVPECIMSYEPDGSGRPLHYVRNCPSGNRPPEPRIYYEAIARALCAADGVLVFGHGTGAGSAMAQFLASLDLHHKDLAARIVGAVVVDEYHLSECELLAKAREFYLQLRDGPDRLPKMSGPHDRSNHDLLVLQDATRG